MAGGFLKKLPRPAVFTPVKSVSTTVTKSKEFKPTPLIAPVKSTYERPIVQMQPLERKPLSDPRAPTTTTPLAKATQDLPKKWATLAPRMPDRGAHVPVNGDRTRLPSGQIGGVPRMPAPMFNGFQRSPIIKGSQSIVQTVMASVKKTVNAQRLKEKLHVAIVKGPSALIHAKAGPLRIDDRGKLLDRNGIGQRVRERGIRGIFAQHLTVPADKVDNAVLARQKRSLTGVRGFARYGAGDPETSKPALQQSAAIAAPIVGAAIGPQRDQESIPVRQSPENVLTVAPDNNNLMKFAFLGAAVFVGWLILKRSA